MALWWLRRGQAMAEYALILALVVFVVVAVVVVLGPAIGNLYSDIISTLPF